MSLINLSNAVGFTTPPRGRRLFFINDVSVRKQDEIIAPSTMGNTTTETTLGSLSVPPLSLTNQGGVRAGFAGTVANATSTGTMTIRTKVVIGGSTVLVGESSGIPLSTASASRSWSAAVLFLGTTMSTELQSWNETAVGVASTRQTAPSTYQGYGNGVVVVPNSTGAATLKVTVQLSVASTGVVASLQSGVLETLA